MLVQVNELTVVDAVLDRGVEFTVEFTGLPKPTIEVLFVNGDFRSRVVGFALPDEGGEQSETTAGLFLDVAGGLVKHLGQEFWRVASARQSISLLAVLGQFLQQVIQEGDRRLVVQAIDGYFKLPLGRAYEEYVDWLADRGTAPVRVVGNPEVFNEFMALGGQAPGGGSVKGPVNGAFEGGETGGKD